jgi:glutamine amidotransferase
MIGVIDYRAGNAPSVTPWSTGVFDGSPPPRPRSTAERIILPASARSPSTSLVEQDLVSAPAIAVGDRIPSSASASASGCMRSTTRRATPTARLVPARPALPRPTGPGSAGTTCASPVRTLTADAPDGGHFYFVNSYHCVPSDPSDALGLTDYTVEFCSVVARDNVVATQFHAEKSGELGLALLRGFSGWEV